MDSSTIYWITRLDGLRSMLDGLGLAIILLGIIGSTLYAIIRYSNIGNMSLYDAIRCPNIGSMAKKVAFKGSVTSIVLGLLILGSRIFIPTTKEMIVIKGVPMVVETAREHKVGEKVDRVCTSLIEILEQKSQVSKKNK